MKIFKLYYSFLLLFCIFQFGCVETPLTIPDFQIDNSERVVLVEYLTGVKCPNCPRGTAILKGVQDQYPDNIAIVSIHGRFLTEPLTSSKYDFRNDFARQLEESYRPFLGKPAALINRVKFTDEPNLAADLPDLWPSYIIEEINKEAKVDIVTNHSLEIGARRFDLNLGVLTKETINGPIKISIYVSENNIIDAQETVGRIIPDYKHDHVLRHMLTAWDGDLLSQNLSKGSIINKRYSYTIPENYVLENLEVVIAVSSLTNREVLQAFKIDL